MNEFSVSRPVGRRKVSRTFNGEGASAAIDGFGRGMECFGFTKGQFSFVDLIEAASEYSGPVHATIATWTAAVADMSRIEMWLKRNSLLSVTWLVDYSFETRQPKFCAQLRETFGDDCIRTVASHAKFVLLRNDDWNIVIQSSMNLNQNKRIENFWIADDPDLFEAYSGLVSDVFGVQGPGDGFGDKPSIRRNEFSSLGAVQRSGYYSAKSIRDAV